MLYLNAQPGSSSVGSGVWDTAAAEGQQNFDFSDHGDFAPDTEDQYCLGPMDDCRTLRPHDTAKWTGIGAASGAVGPAVAGSAAMRRSVSRSSAGSFNSRTQHKQRPHILTGLPSAASCTLTGDDSCFSMNAYYATGSCGPVPSQYLNMYAHQSVDRASSLYGAYGGGSVAYSPELSTSLGHDLGHDGEHVNPTCVQMQTDYDMLSTSPLQAYSTSSRQSSPLMGGENTWSPAESHGSPLSFGAQPEADGNGNGSIKSEGNSGSNGRRNSDQSIRNDPMTSTATTATIPTTHGSGPGAAVDEDYAFSAAADVKRSDSDSAGFGESARDHRLYKEAVCQADGLYHCPWENESNCNHKPEKLKCNYDKFVDSHLKPYRCKNSSCENARFSSTACLLRHEREAHAMHGHGDKPFMCPYTDCERSHAGSGFPRQWNLKDHMRRVHHDNGSQLAVSATAAGSAFVDAPPIAAVGKGRKRRKDTLSSSSPPPSSSSLATACASAVRKTSVSKSSSGGRSRAMSTASSSAAAAAVAAAAAAEAEAEARQAQTLAAVEAANKAAAIYEQNVRDWHSHRDALRTIIDAAQPTGPNVMQNLDLTRMHIDAMGQLSSDIMASSVQPNFMPSFPPSG